MAHLRCCQRHGLLKIEIQRSAGPQPEAGTGDLMGSQSDLENVELKKKKKTHIPYSTSLMDVQKCANKWQIAHCSHRCFWKFSSSTRCIFHFFWLLKDSWNHNPKEVAKKGAAEYMLIYVYHVTVKYLGWWLHVVISESAICYPWNDHISHLGKLGTISDSKVPDC